MIARRSLDRIYRIFQNGSPPRALNDYATHIPILIGLGRIREIKRVLEFGCGHYSTLTFLNRCAFAHLEKLESIENDVSWAATIRKTVIGDARWSLKFVSSEIADCVFDLDLEQFDLILIDDSKTSTQRAATIRAVAHRRPQHPWIVIHDYEVDEYRAAANGFRHRHAFRAFNPQTGLVANDATEARHLRRFLKAKSSCLQPDDIGGWIKCFSSEFKHSSEFKL